MFLRNFDHSITAEMLATGLSSSSISATASGASTAIVATSGLSQNAITGSYSCLGFGYTTICIGNGSTPVTYDDYKLAGSKTSGTFTSVSNTLDYDDSRKVWIRTCVVKYQNTSSSAFTVSEWGIWRVAKSSNNTITWSNNSDSCALIYREVLAEPAVIEPDTIATLTFTLEIPHEVNAQ